MFRFSMEELETVRSESVTASHRVANRIPFRIDCSWLFACARPQVFGEVALASRIEEGAVEAVRELDRPEVHFPRVLESLAVLVKRFAVVCNRELDISLCGLGDDLDVVLQGISLYSGRTQPFPIQLR